MALSYRNAQLSYTEMFTADELTVEIDGITYLLANKGNGTYGAGGSPTSTNPIGIKYRNGVNTMYVTNDVSSGDHHVVIKSESSSIETTECFRKAVRSISSMVLVYRPVPDTIEGATWNEAYNALESNVMLFLNNTGEFIPCTEYDDSVITFEQIWVSPEGVTSFSVQWNSDGTVTRSTATYPSQS